MASINKAGTQLKVDKQTRTIIRIDINKVYWDEGM
jgi:hypothetical protein